MSHFSRVRLVCALLCVSVLPAQAATLYVAPGGSDNSAGTAAAPYKTVQAAVNNAKSGDTVALRAGTYADSGNRDIDISKALTIKSERRSSQRAGRGRRRLTAAAARGKTIAASSFTAMSAAHKWKG